ncbi:MAG: DUF2190 family protein [Planctomycetaceae bacterium]|nr:DUF2190 family protein [Planctomycetaceae bacterium]
MMANSLVQEGDSIDYTPAAAVAAGAVVVQNGLVGVTQRDIAAGDLGSLRIEGVIDFDKTTGVSFAAGDPIYWDATNGLATTVSVGNALIGRAVAAAGSSATSVRGYLTTLAGQPTLLFSSVAASTAITNTTTQTAFDQAVTIPANVLKVGDIIRVRCQGIATATNSTDTLNATVRLGTTDIVATGAIDVANNDIFVIEVDIVIRTIGATGTLVAAGFTAIGAAGTATARPQFKASTAVDTTAALSVNTTATWSVANAGNSCRLDVMNVQLIRR